MNPGYIKFYLILNAIKIEQLPNSEFFVKRYKVNFADLYIKKCIYE